jgi:glycine cleavage system regulatory protein
VHFEVSTAEADALSEALQALEASSGLRIVIAKSIVPPVVDGRRVVLLELVGPDRPGIVREMSRSLADRGVSIEELHTEIVSADSAGHTFKVRALLMVPKTLTNPELQRGLESLAAEMSVDIEGGEQKASFER